MNPDKRRRDILALVLLSIVPVLLLGWTPLTLSPGHHAATSEVAVSGRVQCQLAQCHSFTAPKLQRTRSIPRLDDPGLKALLDRLAHQPQPDKK
jgi:hypothetical protein